MNAERVRSVSYTHLCPLRGIHSPNPADFRLSCLLGIVKPVINGGDGRNVPLDCFSNHASTPSIFRINSTISTAALLLSATTIRLLPR